MRKALVLLIALAVALVVAAGVVAGLGRDPSDPPGLLPDGTVDPAKLPAFVGVVGLMAGMSSVRAARRCESRGRISSLRPAGPGLG